MKHCLIFDIGKTNKKAFVFDENYRLVFEENTHLPETIDDEGESCEDIELLQKWILDTQQAVLAKPELNIQALNCATYGASFVHLDEHGKPVAPLYNYLKTYPADLLDDFIGKYGPAERLSLQTASPLLGHLNSGLQLYWLKYRKPHIYKKIKHTLHLPQWVAYLLGSPMCSETTSLGCHTMLWDFQKNNYHDWVKKEELLPKFPPLHGALENEAVIHSANGLHDSSAALIPYLASFDEPFVLISTGTWCISLNPFNEEPLTAAELAQDCLCYLTPTGKPVKAARYFGGYEHEQALKAIAEKYGVTPDFYLKPEDEQSNQAALAAYKRFMFDELIQKQALSTRLAIGNSPIKKIFVDGGFSKNKWYLAGLAQAFPQHQIFSAEVAQATALGAALAVHASFNGKTSAAVDLVGVRRGEAWSKP